MNGDRILSVVICLLLAALGGIILYYAPQSIGVSGKICSYIVGIFLIALFGSETYIVLRGKS